MKRMDVRISFSIFLFIAVFTISGWAQNYPDTLNVYVEYFDFHSDGSCPDFNPIDANDPVILGMVQNNLDSEMRPVRGSRTYFSHYLSKWYRKYEDHDSLSFKPEYIRQPGTNNHGTLQNNNLVPWDTTYKNMWFDDSLTFDHIGNGVYEYEDSTFFPLDNLGFGKELTWDWVGLSQLNDHNYSFTMMLHREFQYKPGLSFTFKGDDDVWVFIDGKLALDIGGIHMGVEQSFNLDDIAGSLGLVLDEIYMLSFFFAERQANASHIKITSNIIMIMPDELQIIVDPSDTIHVGDTAIAWTQILNDTNGIVTDLPGDLTWTFTDLGGLNHDSTFTTFDDTCMFIPTDAYTTIVIWGNYDDDVENIHLSDSVLIYVLPGDPDHLVIEDTPVMGDNDLNDDDPLDSVFIYETDQYNEEFYAILRDMYGNWIGPAVDDVDTVEWSSDDESIVTARMGTNLIDAQGRAVRATMALIAATDVNGEYDFKGKKLTDDIVVKIMGKTFKLLEATYLDTNTIADGYIDAIEVTVDDSLILKMLDSDTADIILAELFKTISLPDEREFLDNTKVFVKTDDGFIIYVQQDKDKVDPPNTAVDPSIDILKWEDTEFTGIGFIEKGQIPIQDGMGPIIIQGVFDPKFITEDGDTVYTLKVTFSEKVEIPNTNQPFLFNYTDDQGVVHEYVMVLDLNIISEEGDSSDVMLFIVEEIQGNTYPEEGDSIWIKSGGHVDDIVGITQQNETVHVPLIVKPYPQGFTISVIGPFIPNQKINKNLIETFELDEDNQTGTVILVEITGPILKSDKLEAFLSIFDAVGNTVTLDKEGKLITAVINNKAKNYFIFVWSGSNIQGRSVGSGTYLGIVSIYRKGKVDQTAKILIGVLSE